MNVLLTITFNELNIKSPYNDLNSIIVKLKSMPIGEMVIILSHLDSYLAINKNSLVGTQLSLIEQFFVSEPMTRNKLVNIVKADAKRVVFCHQTIYYLISLLLKNTNTEQIDITQIDMSNIKKVEIDMGILLLSLNSYINEKFESPYLTSDEKVLMLWKIGHISDPLNINILSELTRLYKVYKINSETSFSNKFKEITGIDLNEFMLNVFVLYSQLPTNKVFCINSQSIKQLEKLNPNSVDKVLNLLTADIKQLRDLCSSKINAFGHKEYNYEYLKERPILKVNENISFCLSYPYLIKRVTSGILEIMKEIIPTENYNQLTEFYGKAYEDYIVNITKNTYGENSTSKSKGAIRFF